MICISLMYQGFDLVAVWLLSFFIFLNKNAVNVGAIGFSLVAEFVAGLSLCQQHMQWCINNLLKSNSIFFKP